MTYFEMFKQPYLNTDIGASAGGGSTETETASTETQTTETKTEQQSTTSTETVTEQPKIKVKFNHADVELPYEEAVTHIQKGMNYDKAVERAKQEARDAYIAEQGYEWNGKAITTEAEYKQALIEAERAKKIEESGVDPEVVNQLIDEHPTVKQAREITEKTRIATEKAALASKPYFKECEAEVDQLLAANPQLPVEFVFNHVRGQKMDELIAKSDSNAVKRTIADIHDRKSRGLPEGSDSDPEPEIELSAEGKKMAAAFGNDPKEIAKYVKKQIKK